MPVQERTRAAGVPAAFFGPPALRNEKTSSSMSTRLVGVTRSAAGLDTHLNLPTGSARAYARRAIGGQKNGRSELAGLMLGEGLTSRGGRLPDRLLRRTVAPGCDAFIKAAPSAGNARSTRVCGPARVGGDWTISNHYGLPLGARAPAYPGVARCLHFGGLLLCSTLMLTVFRHNFAGISSLAAAAVAG